MTDKQITSIKEIVSSDQLQISLLTDISDKLSKLLVLQGKIYGECLLQSKKA